MLLKELPGIERWHFKSTERLLQGQRAGGVTEQRLRTGDAPGPGHRCTLAPRDGHETQRNRVGPPGGRCLPCLLVPSEESKAQTCGHFRPLPLTYLAPLPPSIR